MREGWDAHLVIQKLGGIIGELAENLSRNFLSSKVFASIGAGNLHIACCSLLHLESQAA